MATTVFAAFFIAFALFASGYSYYSYYYPTTYYGGYYNYFYPTCQLASFPKTITAGSASEIQIQYYDLNYEPWLISINCGNGKYAYAYFCWGTTGTCYASCKYDSPGYYNVYAPYYVGGAYCGYTSVNVVSQQGGSGGGTGGVQQCADGSYYGQCSTNQPKYCQNGVLIDRASLCGCPSGYDRNGDICVQKQQPPQAQQCNDGTAYGFCSQQRPLYCFNGVLIDRASACGCPSGWVRDGERCVLQQQTVPSCVASASPSNLASAGIVTISAQYSNFAKAPQTAYVVCGQGAIANAQCSGGSSGSCIATCAYSSKGTYGVDVLLDTTKCSTMVAVGQSTPPTPSNQPPVYPRSCKVTVDTPLLFNNGSSNVLVTYDNFDKAPSFSQLSCPAFSSLQCTGTQKTGSCTGVCTYATPAVFPTTYTIGGQLDDLRCSASSVTIVKSGAVTPTPEAKGGIVVNVLEAGSNVAVQGAFITLYLRGSVVDTAYSDSNGVATFTQLNAGGYSVTVSKIGYATQSQSGQVVASQNTVFNFLLQKTFASSSCSVALNQQTIRPGGSTSVSVNFNGVNQIPSTALVSCGNGNTATAQCSGSSGSGVCQASCAYGEEQSYPVYKTVSSSINGVNCNSAQLTVIAPLVTTGDFVARISDCADGSGLPGASVLIAGRAYYADSLGLVTASGIRPGNYAAVVSYAGYSDSTVTATIAAGETDSKSVCLNKLPPLPQAQCDFDAQVIRSPECPYSSVPQPYQLKISNKLEANTSITFSYSSNALCGPTSVSLLPLQEKIVDLNSCPNFNFVGGTNVIATLYDGNCTKNMMLNACQSGGLSLVALEDDKTSLLNQKICYPLVVRNRGLGSGLVTMGASPSQSADYEFAPNQFIIASQETKNVNFCVTPRSSGATTFAIKAQSAINDCTYTVVVTAPSQSQFSTNTSGCATISAGTTVSNFALSLYNNALSGDYDLELGSNDLNAVLVQEKLYGFEKNSNRIIDLRLNGFGASAGEHKFDLLLKKNGVVAYQQTLCFNIEGTQTAFAQLKPNVLNVKRGSSGSTTLTVRNTGTVRSTYSVTAPNAPLVTTISPSVFSLNPDDEAAIDVSVASSFGNASDSYVIPIRIFSQSSFQSTSGQYNVQVDCGNGNTQSQTCSGGSSSCSVTCNYPSTGVYSVTSSIGGTSCASSEVRVIDATSNSCILSASSPHVTRGSSTSINVNYDSLSTNPDHFDIDCGNGQHITASSCSGNSGSCSATCSYPDAGSYYVSASSGNGGYSCYQTRVAVSDSGLQACRLSVSPSTVTDGSSSFVTLNYYNLPTSSSSYYYNQYGLVDSFNLLVNLVSGGSVRFEPVVSDTLQVVAPAPVEMTPGSTITVPIVVKNNNYYSLSTVLFSATGLPAGFVINPVSPFSMDPNEEKTIRISITADKNVPISTYSVRLNAQSALAISPEKTLSLRVKPASIQQLAVDVGSPSFAFATSGTTEEIINVSIAIANNEADALTLQPSLDLPQNWTYSAPALTVQPGKTETFVLKLTAPNYTPQDYNATIRVQSGDKVKTMDFKIPSRDSVRNPFSGLFTASSGGLAAIVILILLGIALAAYLMYRANENAEEKTAGQTKLKGE